MSKSAYPFYSITCKPVEGLDEEQRSKHERERGVKFISEDGECQ